MAKKQTKTQKYTNKFSSSIDELIKAWYTANDYNYDAINPNEPGCKANYWAIKLGMTALEDELPYNRRGN